METSTIPTAVDRVRTVEELAEAIPFILDAPKDDGRLDLIVSRPSTGERRTPHAARITAERGVEGDHWSKGCWLTDAEGNPHIDVQICMIPSRVMTAIAGDIQNWPPAGDNLFIDMDLTPSNMPPGTRFALGSAELVVTPEPHNGCAGFAERYGRPAVLFVNTGAGKTHRFRGIYARVTKDGDVTVGDRVKKLP